MAVGSGYISRAGRGKLRHNSGGSEAARTRFCPVYLRATLHTTGKAGKWILSGLLYAKMKGGKRQNIWVSPVNPGLLETTECLWDRGTSRQGAACPLLAKPPIWELQFYLGVAHERKTHFWVLQDIFCPSIGGGLRHSSPADHPPPPHSQRLFSCWCLRDTQGPRAIWKLKNINSCRFGKQEIEIFVIELSLQRVRHNYEVKMENLSGSGPWKRRWRQELCNVARCLSFLCFFTFFFPKIEDES